VNFRTALSRLRVMGFCEGISWAFLLTAMFFKYGPGLSDETHDTGKMAVRIVGSIHGGLFLLYLLAVVNAWIERKWGFGRAFLAGLVSIPPFGTFVFDGSLRHEQLAASTAAAPLPDRPDLQS
jgi:integral membrane protein